MTKRLFFLLSVVLTTQVLAEPVERHGISFSSGWTGLPSFVKKAIAKEGEYWNLQGFNLGVSYVYYGKGGPKGVFSGRYSFTYDRFNVLPERSDFVAQNADIYILDVAAIWTIFPSLPVNLYTGFGTGWGFVRIYNWDVTSPIADPEKVQEAKDSWWAKLPVPLPIIYIPVGLNIRIKNFILNVEAGVRDIPYLSGGFTYAFGKSEDVKIVKETVQLPPPPPDTGKIKGIVIDSESKTPVGRAIIEMKGSGISDLSAGDDGTFVTPELKSGEIELIAKKDGYIPQTVSVKIEQGKTTETTIALKKELQIGAIGGIVTDIQGKPLQATISILPEQQVPEKAGETPQSLSTVSDANTGEYMIKLKPGNYTVNAKLENYKPATMNAVVKAGFKTKLDIKLEPESTPAPPIPPAPAPVEKKSKVYIEKEKIVISETIYFASAKANILPVSFAILDDVAKLLLENPDIKVRIEGHTDNVGRDDLNLRLSQARADSVMKYLIKKGVTPERLEAKGYGETMPIADNSTPEGRAKNRRVEFVITK
jgi:outer membrane protein OmpA-like peptidoglycan-associated protein